MVIVVPSTSRQSSVEWVLLALFIALVGLIIYSGLS
jgi:hypothetical protein